MNNKEAEVIHRWIETKKKLNKARYSLPEWHNSSLEIQQQIINKIMECEALIDKALEEK